MNDLELYYTPKEKQRIKTIEKQRKNIEKKQANLKQKLDYLDSHDFNLYKELSKINNKVDDRITKKCKHDDIYGPYECARDDCSGHHYRCRKCGNQVNESSDEQFKRLKKRWIAWSEK